MFPEKTLITRIRKGGDDDHERSEHDAGDRSTARNGVSALFFERNPVGFQSRGVDEGVQPHFRDPAFRLRTYF
jgi:hypothetical protein